MQYKATVQWHSSDAPFTAKTYDRTHEIELASGQKVKASSAPEFLGNPALANPEELFVASISSCFMLTFLYLASMKNIVITAYQAEAIGSLAKNSEGKMAVTEVSIKPQISFADATPASDILQELFKKAHDTCFISNSVKCNVKIDY